MKLKAKFSHIKKSYVIILVGGVIIGAGLIVLQNVLAIKSIVVTPSSRTDTVKIQSIRGITSLYNKNLLLLSIASVKTELEQNNPTIKDVVIEKQYPHRVLITAVFYNPIAYLKVNNGYFLLSDDGKILKKTKTVENASIPIINYYQQLDYLGFQSGDVISYLDVKTSLKLLVSLLDLGFIINNIDISGFSMIVLNSKDKRFVFTTEKDVSEQEYQFSAIVRKFRTEGKDFKSLDLRFDKPVISL